MTPRLGVAAALLVGLVLVPGVAEGDPAPTGPRDRLAQQLMTPGPVDLDPVTLTKALFTSMRAAGGVQEVVSSERGEVTFEVLPAGLGGPSFQRVSWQEDGGAREVLTQPDGRVCVNRAEGDALHAVGDALYSDGPGFWTRGTIRASDRPYSCTSSGQELVGGRYVTGRLGLLDVWTRIWNMPGRAGVRCRDLGLESSSGGGPVRHLRLKFPDRSMDAEVLSRVDLWVDADLRIVRARLNDLHGGPAVETTAFVYGALAPVGLPDDHGILDFVPAAPAERVSVVDGTWDVEAPDPGAWLVPSLDITSVTAEFDPVLDRVRIEIGFADLRRMRPGLAQHVTIHAPRQWESPGWPWGLHFDRDSAGSSLWFLAVAPHPHFGIGQVPCAGSSRVRPAADLVVLSVPDGCLVRDPGPAVLDIEASGIGADDDEIGWDRVRLGQGLLLP